MKIELTNEQNDILKKYILEYINDKCKLTSIENMIKETYGKYIPKQENIIEIANIFYVNKDEYDHFQDILKSPSAIYTYIQKNFKKLLFIDIDEDAQYNPIINDKDAQLENAVDNGTLVLKIDRIIDFKTSQMERVKFTYSIEEYAKSIEDFIKKKLNVPVRILFNDIH